MIGDDTMIHTHAQTTTLDCIKVLHDTLAQCKIMIGDDTHLSDDFYSMANHLIDNATQNILAIMLEIDANQPEDEITSILTNDEINDLAQILIDYVDPN